MGKEEKKNKQKKITFSRVDIILASVVALVAATLFSLTILIKNTVKLPIKINDVSELDLIRKDLSGKYTISRDLDFSKYVDEDGNKKGWIPIGTEKEPFTGTIDFNYFNLQNLTFSADYIKDQEEDDSIDRILIGFLGYSEGTLIHTNFYGPKFLNIPEIADCKKTIVFGTACAVNKGYVSSCSVTLLGDSGHFTANNLIFGCLVGENKKQLLNDYCANTITIHCSGTCMVGGVAGISYSETVNSYLVRRGYTTIYCENETELYAGGIVGSDFGGNYSNIYHGPANLNQMESFTIDLYNENDTRCSIGGLIGYSKGKNESLVENGYCYNRLYFEGSACSSAVGGIIGTNNGTKTVIKACVADSVYTIENFANFTCGTVVGINENVIQSQNTFYIDNTSIKESFNKSYGSRTTFNSLSLKQLNWPTDVSRGCWSKTERFFLLTL